MPKCQPSLEQTPSQRTSRRAKRKIEQLQERSRLTQLVQLIGNEWALSRSQNTGTDVRYPFEGAAVCRGMKAQKKSLTLTARKPLTPFSPRYGGAALRHRLPWGAGVP